MLKIIFINGKEKIYKENEYEYEGVNEYTLCIRTKNKTIYFPLYNILSYEIENHQKEEKPKRTRNIYGVERVVPDCYTDENDNFPERSWGAGVAQCVRSHNCNFSQSCTKEKGYLF